MTLPLCRILAADDDPTVSLLLPIALAGQNFAVTMVDNGMAALAEFGRAPFDLVLLDVEMPGMDGFEVCAAIRRGQGAKVPVVLVSGRSDPAFVEQAAVLGAACLAKPVDWQQLGTQLRNLLVASANGAGMIGSQAS